MRKFAVIASFPIFIMAVRLLPLNRLPAMCVFYNVTGRPCPTCGMTRAVIALAHLDFRRAMALHPLAVMLAAVFLLLWGMAVHEVLTGRPTGALCWVRRHVTALTLSALGLLLIFGALRFVM